MRGLKNRFKRLCYDLLENDARLIEQFTTATKLFSLILTYTQNETKKEMR